MDKPDLITEILNKLKTISNDLKKEVETDYNTLTMYNASILSKFVVSNKNTDYVPLEPIENEIRSCYKHHKEYLEKLTENCILLSHALEELEKLVVKKPKKSMV